MVDTINPNTNQPDSWDSNQAAEPNIPPVNATNTPENRFFGGFDKPEDVKINLAATEQSQASSFQPPEEPQPEPQPQVQAQEAPQQVVHDVAPVAPAEMKHTSYTNTSDMVNWRGVLVIAAVGIVATLLVGAGIYFGVTAMNDSKIKEQQASLDKIKQELAALQVVPAALELPVTEETTNETTETPVVTTPVVTPTPVETPVTTTPAASDDGSKQAAG